MGDPNPLVDGEALSGSGGRDQVEVGLMEKEARLVNRAFVTWIVQKRPYVALKLAHSLDGNAATRTGDSQVDYVPESRRHAHQCGPT